MALRPSTILSGLLFASAAAGVHAAELGDARVASHIGQPLVADVELTLIEDAGTPVGVRLADPNVYRGANIAMPAVLGTLNMSVTRRDSKQILHLRSVKPVESRHLHVYLELADAGQRSVRLVTLWLTPDPNPAPAPVVVAPVVQPVVKAEPAAVPEPSATVKDVPQAAPVRAKREKPTARAQERAAAVAPVKTRAPAPPLPHAVSVPPPAVAPAPACSPAAASRVDACTALDAKNAALRQDLGRLEDRVKVLQAANGEAPATPEVAKVAEEAVPKEAPRIHVKPKKAAPPEAETPWLLISGVLAALLALGAAIAWLLRRRRRAVPARTEAQDGAGAAEPVPARPGFIASLKARLMAARRRKQEQGASAKASTSTPEEAPVAAE